MATNITKPNDFFLGNLVEECINLVEEQFKEELKTNKGLSYGNEVTLVINKMIKSDVAKRVGGVYEKAGWEKVTWWYTDQRDIKQGTYFKFTMKLPELH